jgi:hypothetical protein
MQDVALTQPKDPYAPTAGTLGSLTSRRGLFVSDYEITILREFIDTHLANVHLLDRSARAVANGLSRVAHRNPQCNHCGWEHAGSCEGLDYGCTFCIERFHTVAEEYNHRKLCHRGRHVDQCSQLPDECTCGTGKAELTP